MPRRNPSKTLNDRGRGRHKRATSPETVRYVAEHLPPEPPAWLDPDTARALYDLRRALDPFGGNPDA